MVILFNHKILLSRYLIICASNDGTRRESIVLPRKEWCRLDVVMSPIPNLDAIGMLNTCSAVSIYSLIEYMHKVHHLRY